MNNVRNIIQLKKYDVWNTCYDETCISTSVILRGNIGALITGNKPKFNEDVNLWFKINQL